MKKILLVEDDALLNKTLTYNLISEGYDTVSALNAGTAAELLIQAEYDLVLLDINLPDGSGYDLCRLIKPENPDTLVIFLTANDQESGRIRGNPLEKKDVPLIDTLAMALSGIVYAAEKKNISVTVDCPEDLSGSQQNNGKCM